MLARLVRGAVRWRWVLVILGAGVGVGWLIMQISGDFGLMLVRPLSFAALWLAEILAIVGWLPPRPAVTVVQAGAGSARYR
ncbi:MAG TPA: hypothetical protein VGJ28_20520 [Micromonosporaceae bacterium]